MKKIELLGNFQINDDLDLERDREANLLFKGFRWQIMEVKIRKSAELPKHKASEPITIFCLSGKGKFFAGNDLEEEQILESGTFITLEADIEHSVSAETNLHILVTKFKKN